MSGVSGHWWHYGPTDTDPDPGKMWHYGCGREVLFIDGGAICGCGKQEGELVDIAEFVKARLDEEQAKTRKLLRAAQDTGLMLEDPKLLGKVIPGWHDWPDVEAMCAARLREVEAKQVIVALHGPDPAGINCDTCHHEYPCATLLHIAAIWAGHPDYDEAWRP